MHSYKTDHPNQVHQLNFSISQNYYLLKSGEIKYQAKKFDVNWKNYEKTGKSHLVNFLIRDHFSNCFYAEIHSISEIPDMKDFLYNAWCQKEYFEFCGIPKSLILGRHIIETFPKLINFRNNTGLNIELATNGFATGIRSVRDWEHNISYYTHYKNYKMLKIFQENTEIICKDLNLRESGKTEANLNKWLNNEPRGILMNDKSEFDKFYGLTTYESKQAYQVKLI
ncbi:hypothetical protein [Pedobacter arcticus]|uniref:hypothetical protein n=1 Tax=Pedobacter arcticus TaxID=752140 RepID=UPI0002D2A8BA|nr:hypothetical protein [Pedobacter arcticus]